MIRKAEKLITSVRAYISIDDLDKIQKALEFSSTAHFNQKRKSGEPYVNHPIEVAKILSEIKIRYFFYNCWIDA